MSYYRILFLIGFVVICCGRQSNSLNRLAFLIDVDQDEIPSASEVQAFTLILQRLLQEKTAPVLVSGSILYNYLVRYERDHDTLVRGLLSHQDWRLFKLHNAKFYLLLPLRYLAAKKISLSEKNMAKKLLLDTETTAIEISHLLPSGRKKGLQEALAFVGADNDVSALKYIDLERLFVVDQSSSSQRNIAASWCFYVGGHGHPLGSIAGLKAKDLCLLLNFFDKKISTKAVYIDSCYAGGRNKQHILPQAGDGYSYPIMIGSLSDRSALAIASDISFERFFAAVDYACKMDSQQDKFFARATRALAPLISFNTSIHGLSSFGQMLPAQTKVFQPLMTDQECVVLRGDAAPEEPVFVRDALAVLLYTHDQKADLVVSPTAAIVKDFSESKNLRVQDLVKQCMSRDPACPELDFMRDIIADSILKKIDQFKTFEKVEKSFFPAGVMYPAFISMCEPDIAITRRVVKHTVVHRIESILLDNCLGPKTDPFFGLLRFFHDAFLDIDDRESGNIFIIDRLTGFNDFSLFFSLSNRLYNNAELAKNFFAPYADQEITLRNVIIKTQGAVQHAFGAHDREREALTISIAFEFKETCWMVEFLGDLSLLRSQWRWPFRRGNLTNHRSWYKKYIRMVEAMGVEPMSAIP